MTQDGVIEIRGLRCRGRQGVTEDERAKEQDYLVDVSVTADLARAIATDDLADALDISAIAATVRGAVAERPRALVERIAADVGSALLEAFAEVREARVRVEKPHPAGLDAEAEAVELTLRR
jgi:dihydroneopterin aldolase